MKQPTKDALREQLALAADEIIELRSLLDTVKWLGAQTSDRKPRPWRRRWFA